MDDLLIAVGDTKLRWRQEASPAETTPTTPEMKMLELAFRMGQSTAGASTASASSRVAEPAQPAFPLLAITNGTLEEENPFSNFM